MRCRPVSLLLLALLLGCPPSEEEEQRAATLSFLESNPTPSSLAVLQPGAAGKLAKIESEVVDDGKRDRLVKALVLIDDGDSHQLLVDILSREPERTSTAFSTARKYQKLSSHLDLLYGGLPSPTQQEVFIDACWPSYSEDRDGVQPTCTAIWEAEPAQTQSRWLRLFTHAGPHDDASPYEGLAQGLADDLGAELDEVVSRMKGGTAIPADPAARDLLRFESRLTQRRARTEGAPTDHRSVTYDGGYVEILPLDPDSDFGRTGARLLADLPMECAATWGAASPGRTSTLEIRLNGSKQGPAVDLVGQASAKASSDPDVEPDPSATTSEDIAELLRACIEIGLTEKHAAGGAPWAPRFGACRITLRSMRGGSWSELEEGRVVMTAADLMQVSEALRETGTPAWRARLGIQTVEEPPLRDLGSTDLGFCMAYVAAGWPDCAHWVGLAATVEKPLDTLLRTGLRDMDPDVRGLCRAALSVSMDEQGLEEAAKPPEPEGSEDAEDDGPDAPTPAVPDNAGGGTEGDTR